MVSLVLKHSVSLPPFLPPPPPPPPPPSLHPLMQGDVSSSACLTCLLLRLDRAVQGSEADSQSEEDVMKRSKESGGLQTTKPSSFDPSPFLQPPLPPHPSPMISLVSCLAHLMVRLFGFDIQVFRVEECSPRPFGRRCSLSFVVCSSEKEYNVPFELRQKQLKVWFRFVGNQY